MKRKTRARAAVFLLLLAPAIILNCNSLTPAGPAERTPTLVPTIALATATPIITPILAQPSPALAETATYTPIAPHFPPAQAPDQPTAAPQAAASSYPEPAGCLSYDEEQHAAASEQARLARADQMLGLARPFSRRILDENWNAYTSTFFPYTGKVVSLSVGDVQNKYLIQRMMDALQVSGFVTWLRSTPQQGLHILAIPLWGGEGLDPAWAPYLRAYWHDPSSTPQDDFAVIPVRKLPPCRWMAAYGSSAEIDASWFSLASAGWPDYVSAAKAYLASTNTAAVQVARRINWLGDAGQEGPNTMCGPLAWSIMHDAGALPPDWGDWSGPKAFWLARPRTNGRPWSIFPPETYHAYSFREPLGKFDFQKFPLYPGDFLYTYSEGDGFDHMLVVTEVDGEGNVYTVTNKIQMVPEKKTTIERLLLLNLNDSAIGIARNQWANDRTNGRTGHAGFEVFRWAWMEKDILAQPIAYTVLPGDTLALIANRWKTPVEQIARYNGVNVDAFLSVGQELQIPPNETVGAR